MSKAIHWQIPFISRKGTSYRIDIYDTYTGSVPSTWPVTLQAGETPFSTQEDSNDDIFTPIRTTTGTIEVIDPDGTLMDQIIPASNLDRYVQLVSIVGSSTTIQWQGFLSCEAYSQEYTDVAQSLSLQVISPLEAMKSAPMTQQYFSGRLTFYQTIYRCVAEINRIKDTNTQLYTNLYMSGEAVNILNKYIDTTLFMNEMEYRNGDKISYTSYMDTAYDVLEHICRFMGLVAREDGTKLYLQRIGEQYDMWQISMYYPDTYSKTHVETSEMAMSNLAYCGTTHNKSISQGANMVEVSANMESYDISFKLPSSPKSDLSALNVAIKHVQDGEIPSETNVVNTQACTRNDYFANMEFWYYQAVINNFTTPEVSSITFNGTSTLANLLNASQRLTNGQPTGVTQTDRTIHAGAYFDNIAVEPNGTQYTYHNTTSYLHCRFIPAMLSHEQNAKLFQITSARSISIVDGYLHLSCACKFVGCQMHNNPAMFISTNAGSYDNPNALSVNNHLRYMLKIGDHYWDGTTWQTSAATFTANFDNNNFTSNWEDTMGVAEGKGLYIPVSCELNGQVSFAIYFGAEYHNVNFLFDVLFSDISIEYLGRKNGMENDETTNKYFIKLNNKFADTISVETKLASNNNNVPSPSLVLNSNTGNDYMSQLQYYPQMDYRRPEIDLLNRLSAYYASARRKLELEAEHPTAAALPMLTVTGYDNKTYIPIAESRNWQEDTATLTLMESPE